MTRQIDLQRRHGHITIRDGMEIRARPRVVPVTCGSDPIYWSAARILGAHDPLGSMPIAEASHLIPLDELVRQIGHVDVEDRRLQRRALDAHHQLGGDARRSGVVPAGIRLDHQRDRDGRQSQEAALDRGRDGAGIQHVVAEVRAVVDPRDDHVVVVVEQPGDGQMHAIRRRAVADVVSIGVMLKHAQRYVEREGIAGAAAITIRRDDGDVRQRLQCLGEREQTVRAITVVVTDQDLHKAAETIL